MQIELNQQAMSKLAAFKPGQPVKEESSSDSEPDDADDT
jgi:hypothetical protein